LAKLEAKIEWFHFFPDTVYFSEIGELSEIVDLAEMFPMFIASL